MGTVAGMLSIVLAVWASRVETRRWVRWLAASTLLAVILIVLIVLQITPGILTVLKRKPADVASAHVAVGALILATMFILSVRVVRLCARSEAAH
jgi:heme A synthase